MLPQAVEVAVAVLETSQSCDANSNQGDTEQRTFIADCKAKAGPCRWKGQSSSELTIGRPLRATSTPHAMSINRRAFLPALGVGLSCRPGDRTRPAGGRWRQGDARGETSGASASGAERRRSKNCSGRPTAIQRVRRDIGRVLDRRAGGRSRDPDGHGSARC